MKAIVMPRTTSSEISREDLFGNECEITESQDYDLVGRIIAE